MPESLKWFAQTSKGVANKDNSKVFPVLCLHRKRSTERCWSNARKRKRKRYIHSSQERRKQITSSFISPLRKRAKKCFAKTVWRTWQGQKLGFSTTFCAGTEIINCDYIDLILISTINIWGLLQTHLCYRAGSGLAGG